MNRYITAGTCALAPTLLVIALIWPIPLFTSGRSTIKGVVTLPGKVDNSGITVAVGGFNDYGIVMVSTTTNNSGQFILSDLPKGKYELMTHKEGFLTACKTIVISHNDEVIITPPTMLRASEISPLGKMVCYEW